MKTKEETLLILKGLGFNSFDLSGANLRGADLRGANLSEANLSRADLYAADLNGANLSGADLRVANLSGADLEGANLRGADLNGADLSEANLMGANLRRADLNGANLNLIKGKKISTFQFNRHFAYYCDGIIKIGCKSMDIKDWLKKYKKEGQEGSYTDIEIKLYGKWIKMINKEFGGKDEN